MTINARTWIDLDLDFKPHPVTGDVVKKFNDDAIKRAVKNLLTIDFYEKPFHPEIGSGLRSLLFEPLTLMTASVIRNAIQETLLNFEPRVNIETLNVVPVEERNGFDVELRFFVVNLTTPITLEIFLEKIR